MKHVHEQNWFAVGIDFLIVVIGVFIGIQVANWNAQRLEDRQESRLIQRLIVDFERISVDAQQSLSFHSDRLSEFQTLVSALREGKLLEEDRAAVHRALYLGFTLQTSADRSGTFTELLSSGRAYLLKDENLVNEMVAYEDFLQRFNFAQEFLAQMIIDLQQPFSAGFQRNIDGAFITSIEEVDQVERIYYDFDSMVVNPAFKDSAEQLMFIHSVALLWRTRISDRVLRIQQMLSEAS
ncbi:MAG: hypothetical protein AAGJ52_09670 [Pseudomonadota bacterium]